ncbi:MAG: DUF6352 family protein [Xanthobacteraceae bacterium]
MKDFWLSCGHHLLDRDEGGGLVVTDEFLKVYLARPELAPPPDACVVEKSLHAALMADPQRPVDAGEIAAIADPDARENWTMMIAFRDRLLRHPTIEAAYLALVRGGIGATPPIFINQLVHVILRNVLDECEDPWILRAAEMFFRPQRITVHEGALLAADEEVIAGDNPAQVSPLVGMLGIEVSADIDVLVDENVETYFERSDRHDMALDLTAGRRGHHALARVIERWVGHLLNVEVEAEPLTEVQNVNLTWYVGLDAEGTRIGDLLWNGESLDDATGARVAALYRLKFRDPAVAAEAVKGEPVYLILATTQDKVLRMKPQNLVTGLPVRHLEAVS